MIYVLAVLAALATLGYAYRDRQGWTLNPWSWKDTTACLLLAFPFWTGVLFILCDMWQLIAANL
jgi:hypothetical protein